MGTPLVWRLPGPPPPHVEKALADGRQELCLELPEGWCYRIHRQAPPGGWTRRLCDSLRPGLFPLALDLLWWDEEQGTDRSWQIWAVERARLDSALASWVALVWAPGRKVRVCPVGAFGAGSRLWHFPNLARPNHRPRRWPVIALRRAAVWGLPAAALLAGASLGVFRDLREGRKLETEIARLMKSVSSLQAELDGSKGLAEALSRLRLPQGDPPWIRDLDGLTRLLPEDSRVVDLHWKPSGLQIDLITPHPELVRDALEASPEFRNVRFVGNLERRADKSRLTLDCEREGGR